MDQIVDAEQRIKSVLEELPPYVKEVAARIILNRIMLSSMGQTAPESAEDRDAVWQSTVAEVLAEKFQIDLNLEEHKYEYDEFYIHHGLIVEKVITSALELIREQTATDAPTADQQEIGEEISRIFQRLFK